MVTAGYRHDWMSEGTPMTILVVDDKDDVRNVVSEFLRRDGYRVLPSDGALDALGQWREHQDMDLVVTDFDFGGPTAHALIDAIRAEGGKVPILLVTGKISDEEAERIRPKVVEILHKPVRRKDLLAAATRVLFGVVSKE